jgi:hypothetical protein
MIAAMLEAEFKERRKLRLPRNAAAGGKGHQSRRSLSLPCRLASFFQKLEVQANRRQKLVRSDSLLFRKRDGEVQKIVIS